MILALLGGLLLTVGSSRYVTQRPGRFDPALRGLLEAASGFVLLCIGQSAGMMSLGTLFAVVAAVAVLLGLKVGSFEQRLARSDAQIMTETPAVTVTAALLQTRGVDVRPALRPAPARQRHPAAQENRPVHAPQVTEAA